MAVGVVGNPKGPSLHSRLGSGAWLASSWCCGPDGPRQAPALPVGDPTESVAESRTCDFDTEHGADVSNDQVADCFRNGGPACQDGMLGSERSA
jgi:hypothetical protein